MFFVQLYHRFGIKTNANFTKNDIFELILLKLL